jgi:hypothetical protein
MTKEELLGTGYFIDNEHLTEYLDLVSSSAHVYYQEKHHILPRQYFKLIGKPCDNTSYNLVSLSYIDHCKAHYLLTLCTIGKLRSGSLYTLNLMTNSSRAKFSKLSPEEQRTVKIYSASNDLFWTEEEDAILKANYATEGTACAALLPNRTRKAIKSRALLIGLTYAFEQSDHRRYTAEEDRFLIENYQKFGVTYCATALNRSPQTIKSRAAKVLKITKPPVVLWTQEEVDILMQFYPSLGPNGIADKLPRRKPRDISKKAHRLGIKYNRYN